MGRGEAIVPVSRRLIGCRGGGLRWARWRCPREPRLFRFSTKELEHYKRLGHDSQRMYPEEGPRRPDLS